MPNRSIAAKAEVENRRRQLRKWIDTQFGGVQAKFVEAHALNQGEISSLLKDKSFGGVKARNLEAATGMPHKYLDLTDEDFAHQIAEISNLSPAPAPGEDAVRVPLLANAGSMGPGTDTYDGDVIVGAISLSPEWLDKRIRPSSYRALGFIHAYGDSMSPTFEDGDILLVDTGVRDPSGADGVYVLEANHRIFIKRITEKLSGGHIVTSDNPSIKTADELNGDSEVQVKGKVVWVWNGRKL